GQPTTTTAPLPAPMEQPATSATAAPETEAGNAVTAIDEAGLRFAYDPALATGVTVETVPAEEPSPDAGWWMVHPQHRRASFAGYPSRNLYHQPHVAIYPAEEFAAMSETAAQQIGALKTLLAEQPAAPEEELPVLPLINAAQVIQPQVRYLPFANGTGVRFVTQYNQDAGPISNQGLFYTFQGLTAGGRFYVSAIFPVTSPALPDDPVPVIKENPEDFAEGHLTYLAETEDQLDALSAEDFEPNLDQLDALIQSLEVR
ncbi:MAG TPA: hypothetical protein VER55_14830, partial [Ardenticatenaceae bacterium]|nr:hypothetical protein [Ardenticatenaceae bacterium]